MNSAITALSAIPSWVPRPAATPETISAVESEIGCSMPNYYKELLLWSDGGEASIGGVCLRLLSCGQMVNFFNDYEIGLHLPGYILIGNDGGDTFFYLKCNSNINSSEVMMLADSLFEDEMKIAGKTFDEFISRYQFCALNRISPAMKRCGQKRGRAYDPMNYEMDLAPHLNSIHLDQFATQQGKV